MTAKQEPPEPAIFTIRLTEKPEQEALDIPRCVIISTHVCFFHQQVQLIEGDLSDWAFASVPAGYEFFSHERAGKLTKVLIGQYKLNQGWSALIQSIILSEYRIAQERTRSFNLPSRKLPFDKWMHNHGSYSVIETIGRMNVDRGIPIHEHSAPPQSVRTSDEVITSASALSVS